MTPMQQNTEGSSDLSAKIDVNTPQLSHNQLEQASERFKALIEAVTTFEQPQLKIYLHSLLREMKSKTSPFLSQFNSIKEMLDGCKDTQGRRAIHFACQRGDVAVVIHLIEDWNVDSTLRDNSQNSPLLTATQKGHLSLVRYFVEHLCHSVEQIREGNISCLHLSCNSGDYGLVEYLLNKGANPERIALYGKPLNWAVGNMNVEIVKLLLERGADPNGDCTGSTPAPLLLAIDFAREDIYQLLVQKNARIDVTDPNGYPALYVAAEKGLLPIVNDLLCRGANPNVITHGKTALYIAFLREHWDIVNLIKSRMPLCIQLQKNIQQSILAEKTKSRQFQKDDCLKARQQDQNERDEEAAQRLKIQGNRLYGEKQYDEALILYERSLRRQPGNEVVHRNAAACLLALKRFEQALFHCGLAKRKDPKNIKTLFREASAYSGLGNHVQAAATLWECSLVEPNNEFFKNEFLMAVQKARADKQ